MRCNRFSTVLTLAAVALATLVLAASSAQAAALLTDFQATIASEQHPTYGGEARYYHVSVNPNNPGTGSYAATIVGTNNAAPTFVRNYTDPVVSYKFLGGTSNDISGIAASGGDASLITYATSDTVFDGYGQGQAKIWTTTDPGADLQTTVADPYAATADTGGGGYRSFGGAIGTIDVSGLATGSVHVYYGAFSSTPTVSAVMRDTDGPAPDITITDAHLNGDYANRTEYYLAELDFVNDAGYDVVEYTWLANGVDYSGNGRGLGTVLTGTESNGGGGPEPASLTLGSRVLVSENNANFDISVFPGKASYNDRGVGGTEPGTPTFTNTFGDGTVEDYNFFHSPSETIVSYADGGAGLISDATSDAGNINGSGENWSNVWTTSDPGVDFNTTKDFTNGSVPNTFARSADLTGTIDISGLESGTVYIPHGTYINQWDLTLTMTGDGQPDLVANDAQTSNGPGRNFGWITDFSFSNPGLLYDTIDYTYFNADRDGSRARFMGVILDGTSSAVPEPSTFALAALGLLGLGWYGRRRRMS